MKRHAAAQEESTAQKCAHAKSDAHDGEEEGQHANPATGEVLIM
jgi:hypothetical protein